MIASQVFFLFCISFIWKVQTGNSEQDGIYEVSIPDYETLPETDILLYDDIEVDPRRNAVPDESQLWPKGVIPYSISSSYPQVVRDKILAAMREIENNVNSPGKLDCIRFKQIEEEHDYIKILPRGSRCSSPVGRKNYGRQEVSIGRGCESQGIIMHELLHTIGFHHEQTRPDRDSYIDVNFNNIEGGQRHNFVKHSESKTLNTPYDYSSIMHYGPYTFGLDLSRPTLTPKRQVPAGAQLGQRIQLSRNDVLKIQRLYKCKEDTSHVVQRVTSSGDRCDFSQGLCNFTQDGTDDFDWVVQSGPSASGPKSGVTTGRDNYAIAKAAGRQGKSARLVSRMFSARKLCVDYSFYFCGDFVGNGLLKLLVKPKNSRRSTLMTGSWLLYGRQEWSHKRQKVVVTSNVPYQLVFEAAIFKVDIALDNIVIYEGDCV